MLRASFFSIGLFVGLWGVSLLVIDRFVLNYVDEDAPPQNTQIASMSSYSSVSATAPPQQKVIDPPDWAAFSIISAGAVTMLYAVALPKK
ncbi:MAG: hypothetical protein ACREJB_12870 [Planctomycetaceae bacterium]